MAAENDEKIKDLDKKLLTLKKKTPSGVRAKLNRENKLNKLNIELRKLQSERDRLWGIAADNRIASDKAEKKLKKATD